MKSEKQLLKIYNELFNQNSILQIEYVLTGNTDDEEAQTLTFNFTTAVVDCSNIKEQVLSLNYTNKNTFEEDKLKLFQLMAEKFQNGYDSVVRINQYYKHPSMLLKNIYEIKPKQTVYLLSELRFYYCDINSIDEDN